MIKNKKIAFRLRLYVLTGVLIIFSAIMLIDYLASRNAMVNTLEEKATYQALSTVKTIENVLDAAAKIPENLAPILENTDYSEKQIKSFLRPIVAYNDEVFGACVAFEPYTYARDRYFFAPYYYKDTDSLRYKILGNDNYVYFYLDWYQIPHLLNRPVWTEPYFDEDGGNIIMTTYSVPFYKNRNGQRRFNGITTVDIDLSWLRNVIDSISLIKGGYAFLISRTGTILTHPFDSLVMNETIFSLAEESNNPRLRRIGQSMIAGETDFIKYNPFSHEGDAWMYYTNLPENGWSLGIIFPEEELLAGLHNLYKTLIFLGIAGLLLLLIVITIISKRITTPIERLAAISEQIGLGNFDIPLPPVKNKDEIGKLTHSFEVMKEELKSYIRNLKDTTAAKEKIESELKIAHDIQQGIIPKIFPPFPDREDVDLYAILDPAKEVGGDLYDFFFVDEHQLIFAIGDVSGKGVPASLFMAISRTLLRAKASPGRNASKIVSDINNELCIDNDNAMFVTFFIGILDLKTGELDFCNAGHNYPYIRRHDATIEQIATTHGTPLGLFEDQPYKSGNEKLYPGDSVILYTDGIPEAMNKLGEIYSDDRLKTLLQKIEDHTTPREITGKMLESTKVYAAGAEQSDDITILVLTYYLKKDVIFNKDEIRLSIINQIEEIRKVETFSEKMAEKWNLPTEDIHKINLVLEEVVSNIINYGYEDRHSHHISITAAFENNRAKIRVKDDAKPFNPLEQSDPETENVSLEEREVGGLGIFLVKKMMERVSYSRTAGHNILILEKQIKTQ